MEHEGTRGENPGRGGNALRIKSLAGEMVVSRFREYAKTAWKQARRAGMQTRLLGLVSWQSLSSPSPGYTVVIAAMHRLWPVLVANLQLIARMDLTGMREVVVVFDCEEQEIPRVVRDQIADLAGRGLKVRLMGYTAKQAAVARSIQWGWVYSWMSWCIGIGSASTRWVLLHDLDALPIDEKLFQHLAQTAQRHDVQFQGARFYAGCGVVADMGLVTTFEMVLDAQWLRGHSVPYDGFNKVRIVDGRSVDFDTFLSVQRRAPRRRVEPIAEHQLVHPSQLVCQYTDHIAGRRDRTSPINRLPILAYFMRLGDPSSDLNTLASGIADPERESVLLWGKPLNIGSIPPETWAWMEKQIRRVEQHLYGATRPGIEDFLIGFKRRAGDRRTVGSEALALGGVEDR